MTTRPARFRRPMLAALAAAAALVVPRAHAADLFSPGELSRAHQSLEGGLQTCTKCHVAGQRLAPERCLECHTELRARVEQKLGFHGRLPPSQLQCQSCHHEHQGRDEALVDWGRGGQKGFDHARAGFELKGKHRTVDCAKCHDARRVADPTVRAALQKQPGRKTFLGQPQACNACHFDEHRGQLGAECQRCHTEEGWKPVRGFDHAHTAFPLTGRHARVDCARCHLPQEQPAVAVPAAVTPPVNAGRFSRWKGLAFQQCGDCHKDPHQDRFGASCTQCHTTDDWKRVGGAAAKRAFHDQTRYPLRGAHALVACQRCHGPFPGQPVRYRGLAFAQCTDCHKDPHQDRFGASCTQCHTTDDWKRVSGSASKRAFHEQTRYPLRGAHASVACQACHGPFQGQPARYRGLAFARCTDCHMDAHLGQLGALARAGAGDAIDCERCHTVESYLPAHFELEDHDRTGFKLEGAHRTVACVACHVRDPQLAWRVPVLVKTSLEKQNRPLRVSLARFDRVNPAECQACHRDPHAGQFDRRVKAEGCTACHGMTSFRLVRFDHSRDASFPLQGKHAQAACGSCHRPDTAGVVRYVPLSSACASCHADPHAGQFAEAGGKGTDCLRCHRVEGWKDIGKFVHAPPFTSFLLTGKHQGLACDKCHPGVQVAGTTIRKYRAVPTRCQGCHEDFHRGAFRGFVP